MYKIGIIGHGPEDYSDKDKIRRTIDQTIELLNYQYNCDLVYNVAADIGVGQWATSQIIEVKSKYHLYLSSPTPSMYEHWYVYQQKELDNQMQKAYGITICSDQYDNLSDNKRDRCIIDDSNFIVCFWTGKKRGKVFDAIKYAWNTNKLILDGLDHLKLIIKS